MYYKEYPTFNEIKEDLSKEELLEIIDMSLDTGLSIDEVISDFIKDTYEDIKVLDVDFAYECYRDMLMNVIEIVY